MEQPQPPLPPLKRAVLLGMAALAVAGTYVAVANLPVVSGCGFHADCPERGRGALGLPSEPPAAVAGGPRATAPAGAVE